MGFIKTMEFRPLEEYRPYEERPLIEPENLRPEGLMIQRTYTVSPINDG